MSVSVQRTVIAPEEGRLVHLGGVGVAFKIAGVETGAAYSVVEHPVEPGALVPPHVHTREDEWSYVIEGTFGARIGDEVLSAGPGSYIFKPRGVPHTFWNAGPGHARLIEIISPSGFERYFEEMAALFPADGGPPDFGQVTELAAGYGLSFVMEWVPELTAKYNLRVLGR